MTIESQAQFAPTGALGIASAAPKILTSPSGDLPGSLSSRHAKSEARDDRQKAAKSRTFMPALLVSEEPPPHLTSRTAKGRVPWADWHLGRCADVVRQIRKDSLLVRDGPAINPRAFDAYVEYVVLTLAAAKPDLYGAGFLRLMLAERSFMNRPKDADGKPIPNAVEVCNPKASKRKVGAAKEKGALAIRSGLSSEAIYRLNRKREAAGLLTIERSTDAASKRQGPNNYSFGENFLSEIGRYIRSEGHRLAAEIVLAAFVLPKFQKDKGYAEFARRDLTTCGLDRLHFADAGLRRILSRYDDSGKLLERGLFTVIGVGRVTLPEIVELGHFKGLDAAMIWPRLEPSSRSSRSVDQPVLNDHPDQRLEWSPRSSRTVTRPSLEASPGSVLNDHPYEQQEVFEQQEVEEQREGVNGALSHLVESNRIHGVIEPHEPDYGSGKPSPLPGEENGRNDDEGKRLTQEPEVQLVTSVTTSASKPLAYDVEAWRREVVGAGDNYNEGCRRLEALVPVDELANRVSRAIGPVMPESKRWHRQAVSQWMLHKFRKVLMAGADDTWLVQTVQDIGHEALHAGQSFPDWRSVSLRFDLALKNKLGGSP